MKSIECQVLVIGGGPGGYVSAIRAGQLGLNTVLVESDRLGGTCLNRGCIPSKALIYAAGRFAEFGEHRQQNVMGISLTADPLINLGETVRWKEGIVNRLNIGLAGLLRKANVNVVEGWASFVDAKNCKVVGADEEIDISAEHVILATGSTVTPLPNIPFGERVLSSTEALNLTSVPESLVIVGAGYIGLELGIAYRKLGVRVTFVEAQDRILPLYDKELTKPVKNWLRQMDVQVLLNTQAIEAAEDELSVSLRYKDIDGQVHSEKADYVMVTVGRRPRTQGWGLENMCVDMNGAFVSVDAQCRTAMKNVWAIGDLIGEPMLAHKASAQGEMVAEIIAGKRRHFDPVAIPAVCFTEPEIVSCGLSPEQSRSLGYDIVVSQCPLAAIGKVQAMGAGNDGGFVRIVARKDNHLILGIQAVGKHVAELSGEFVLALEMGARLEDVAHTIHMHPTVGESFHEAALAGLGCAIHF